MRIRKMAVTEMHGPIAELARKSGHRMLAVWAADCAERVLHYFEEKRPGDGRPGKAIRACREWAATGVFRMADVRGASLAAHAAAREVEKDDAARSAARAAGQAMATTHVPAHAIAAAVYAATAVKSAGGDIMKEREWQYKRLLGLGKNIIKRETIRAV